MIIVLLMLALLYLVALIAGYVLFVPCLLLAGTCVWGTWLLLRGWLFKDWQVRSGRDGGCLAAWFGVLMVASPFLYWQVWCWLTR